MWNGASQVLLLCAFLLILSRCRREVLDNEERMSLSDGKESSLTKQEAELGLKVNLLS